LYVVYDLRVDRAGGGHLERRGSHYHIERQTGVKEAGFSRLGLPKHPQEIDQRVSGWICNMELFDITGFFADFPPLPTPHPPDGNYIRHLFLSTTPLLPLLSLLAILY
jgi:hypothetical protein